MKVSEKKNFCLSKISKYLIRIWVRGDFLQLWHYWIEAYTTGINILNSHVQGAVFQKWYEVYVSNFVLTVYALHIFTFNSQKTINRYTFLLSHLAVPWVAKFLDQTNLGVPFAVGIKIVFVLELVLWL